MEAKERLAGEAVGLLEPGDSVFLDCSITTYYLARVILREGPRVTLLTNSVPVMELVMKDEAPRMDIVGVGGVDKEAHAVIRGTARHAEHPGALCG